MKYFLDIYIYICDADGNTERIVQWLQLWYFSPIPQVLFRNVYTLILHSFIFLKWKKKWIKIKSLTYIGNGSITYTFTNSSDYYCIMLSQTNSKLKPIRRRKQREVNSCFQLTEENVRKDKGLAMRMTHSLTQKLRVFLFTPRQNEQSQAPVFWVGILNSKNYIIVALSVNHHFKWVAAHLVFENWLHPIDKLLLISAGEVETSELLPLVARISSTWMIIPSEIITPTTSDFAHAAFQFLWFELLF